MRQDYSDGTFEPSPCPCPTSTVNRAPTTCAGKTRTGNPRYWFSRRNEGDLVDSIPEGYEIYENPDALVFLRKIVPQQVTPSRSPW